MQNSELEIFNQAIIKDENGRIFVQFLCDYFGIDSKYQYKTIQNDHILRTQVGKKTNYSQIYLNTKHHTFHHLTALMGSFDERCVIWN